MTDDKILPDYECIDCKSKINNSTLDDSSGEFTKEIPMIEVRAWVVIMRI